MIAERINPQYYSATIFFANMALVDNEYGDYLNNREVVKIVDNGKMIFRIG